MTVSVKMIKAMRWRSLVYKKFKVSLCIHHFYKHPFQDDTKFLVDVKWRGPKRSIGPRFRSVKTDRSTEAIANRDGLLEWEQNFECECTFALAKETGFQPWDVYLVVRKVTKHGSKHKTSLLGKTHLNLADLAPTAGNASQKAEFPILSDGKEAALSVTLNFEELRRTVNEPGETNLRIIAPVIPCISGWDREEFQESRLKAVKSILTSTKKSSGDDTGTDERLSPTSEESSQDSPGRFDTDSTEEDEDSDNVDDAEISITTSFRYGRIAEANMIIGRYHGCDANEEGVYFSGGSAPKLVEETSSSDSDQTTTQSSMRRMLSWRKRKLSFRSPRARGEPLLNKAYGDNGGDEIDWDRRQAICGAFDYMMTKDDKKPARTWDFGESFKVGSWENKELISRDGKMKLAASVFFASIDQRSESASGESACTALVAVIADWLHRYTAFMPSRAEFDSLIRDGSAEWRKLCQDATYKDSFSDGHFDLETVLEAGVRPLSVLHEKSFVGFFQPEGMDSSSDFLEDAMSFDAIWDEVERQGAAVYIVSWNDHFFILKMEEESVYIIDTLGERLFEGCNQAYLLKFDQETRLSRNEAVKEEQSGAADKQAQRDEGPPQVAESTSKVEGASEAAKAAQSDADDPRSSCSEEEQEAAAAAAAEACSSFTGKSSCREFIKSFFAAVPLRELQSDVKKGLVGKECLHKRLQVEFHLTSPKAANVAS